MRLEEGGEEGFRPLKYIEYIKNDFEDRGDVVIDHATGLMWQKSGSDKPVSHEKAQAYIKQLNRQRFAGYDDWRLPTIPDLLSLLEPELQSNGLYINSIFDDTQKWCRSADIDKESSDSVAWRVSFIFGHVTLGGEIRVAGKIRESDLAFVRCVRSSGVTQKISFPV